MGDALRSTLGLAVVAAWGIHPLEKGVLEPVHELSHEQIREIIVTFALSSFRFIGSFRARFSHQVVQWNTRERLLLQIV